MIPSIYVPGYTRLCMYRCPLSDKFNRNKKSNKKFTGLTEVMYN